MGEHAPTTEHGLVVTVVRTGGIAGLRREWTVQPAPDDVPHWLALIDECPWDDPPVASRGADRYLWRVRACTPEEERAREIADGQLSGAWRTLVDAVREAGGR